VTVGGALRNQGAVLSQAPLTRPGAAAGDGPAGPPAPLEDLSPIVVRSVPATPENVGIAKVWAKTIAEIPMPRATPQIALIQRRMGELGYGTDNDRSYTLFLEYAHVVAPEEIARMRRNAIKGLIMLGLDYYLTVGTIMLPVDALAAFGAERVAGLSLEEAAAIEYRAEQIASKNELRIAAEAQAAKGTSNAIGDAGERALSRVTGASPDGALEWQLREWTPSGKLRVTDAVTSLRHESKNTFLRLSSRMREQMQRDSDLWAAGGGHLGEGQPFWHLWKGATEDAKAELRRRGFLFRDYTELPDGSPNPAADLMCSEASAALEGGGGGWWLPPLPAADEEKEQ
jgi:hypothetical protein